MTFESFLPALAGFATAAGAIWLNNKKQNAATQVSAAEIATTASKNQYEIWQAEWSKIVKALEDRIADIQKELDETREELRAVHMENAKMIAELAECKRTLQKHGITDGK